MRRYPHHEDQSKLRMAMGAEVRTQQLNEVKPRVLPLLQYCWHLQYCWLSASTLTSAFPWRCCVTIPLQCLW